MTESSEFTARIHKESYIAGIIDGDGSAYIVKRVRYGKSPNFNPVLTLCMTSPEPVDIFSSFTKCERSVISRHGRKDLFRVTVKSEMMMDVLRRIIPFLVIKRRLCELLLALQEGIVKQRFRPLTQCELHIRNLIYNDSTLLVNLPDKRKWSEIHPSSDFDAMSYIGGIVDSEGFISMRKRMSYYYPYIGVKMADMPAISLMSNKFGGNIHNVRKPNPNCIDMVKWQMDANKALSVIKEILPFVIVKRKQIEYILSWKEGSITSEECFRLVKELCIKGPHRIDRILHWPSKPVIMGSNPIGGA